jgi:phospholipase/carboxylesterase
MPTRYRRRVNDEPLEVFEIAPKGEARGTVIWMHGLGATNHDFDDVVPLLELQGVRFVFPNAPVLPVTINGGMSMPAWYDILSFDDPPLREDESTLRASAERVNRLIDAEIARGVAANRIVLMGFSQGGAMALHVGLRRSEPLLGIASLSGYLVLPQRLKAERNPASQNVPVLFCHGSFDPVVPLTLGESAYAAVRAENVPAVFHTFPMQHSLCMPEIETLKRWLHDRFDG